MIQPGTHVYSDKLRRYDCIGNLPEGFDHSTVNHSENYVDPETGAHTQSIESLWGRLKAKMKSMRGTSRSQLNSYLCEACWRHENGKSGNNCFFALMASLHYENY